MDCRDDRHRNHEAVSFPYAGQRHLRYTCCIRRPPAQHKHTREQSKHQKTNSRDCALGGIAVICPFPGPS